MPEPAGDDAWVLARLSALERANRRLWTALAGVGMTLLSLFVAVYFAAAFIELPGRATPGAAAGSGASLVADDVTVHGALRVVDEAGQSLVFIGRERAPGASGDGASSAVIGLFAGAEGEVPKQTIRIATAPLGSALSLSTPDGASSSSIFAGESGAQLELRRGEQSRLISERAEGASAGARAPAPASGKRAEGPAVSSAASGSAERAAKVDLNDPVLQLIGDGFYVARMSLSDEGGALRVTGRLVNTTSVDQTRAEFRLSVAGREIPFSVGRIEAGGSSEFSVELPSSSAEELGAARMRWVRSTLRYRSD